jgi:TRAP-type mannitol/chloroaromatic compound transport system substrate-binding protein
MGKRNRLLTILGVAGLILSFVLLPSMPACAPAKQAPEAAAPAPAAPEFVWDFQNMFPETDGSWFIQCKMWKQMIEQRTNGRIEFVLHPADTVAPASGMVAAIQNGTLDGGAAFTEYNYGLIGPVAYLEFLGTFFGPTDMYWLQYYGGIIEIIQEAYAKHNLHFFANCANGSYWVFCNFKPDKVEALKGRKIIASGLAGEWVAAFGAAPVDIPFEEMYMAMKLGTVDGLAWTALELETMGWGEVSPYVMTPAINDPTTGVCFLINMDSWNALPDDLKAIMTEFAQDQWWTVGMAYYNYELKNIELAKKHFGTTFIRMSPEDEAKMVEAKKAVYEAHLGVDPLFDKGWAIMESYKPITDKL